MDSKMLIHGGRLLAKAVEKVYAEGQTDYSIEPLVRMDESGTPVGSIQEGDAVIFCCRRGEREIELTEAFTEPDFSHFERQEIKDLNFIILTLYHEKFKDLPVAFAPSNVSNTLGEIVSKAGLRQLRCSETEKFAHITFFLNGGINKTFAGEDHIRIPSPKGIPFDQVPELSLPKVADEVIKGIHSGYDLIITNFANGDVIGHTANSQAKIQCAEHVDKHLGKVVKQAIQKDYVIAITADHGNLELMLTEDGKPHVAHTTNLVPFILIDPRSNAPLSLNDGSLQDITPTILNVLGIPQPEEMTGNDLSNHHEWGTKRHMLLIILDGWGKGKEDQTNPIHLANTPAWDELIKKYPPSLLQASGDAVGLQEGKAGNSEAGHMNIGAGRIVLQDDVRLDQAIKDGTFSTNTIFLQAIKGVKDRHSHLHLIGLLTEKSSHGSIDYPLAVLKIARDMGVQDIYLHLIFDGRSTEPGSAPALLEKLDDQLAEIGAGVIATGMGRGIALDRDGNYEKIQRAYEALVLGKGRRYS
jgi:2,3-bisphosphoglycerate-independent phosphoglycerate mutase